MINEMRANHELRILETPVLGRAYLGAGLMPANLKDADRTSLKTECSGPIRGLTVEANAIGRFGAFLRTLQFPLTSPCRIMALEIYI
jgi:molecular chaperone Hsp33